MTAEIDWMGRWYLLMKERGENDAPTLGRLHLKSGEIDWFRFSHSQMDGIGAFVKYYQNFGISLSNLPEIRENKVPNFWERIKIFYRLIFKNKKIKTQWLEHNEGLAPGDPLEVWWHVFNPIELERIESYCKENKFSLNAYVMNKASKILLQQLTSNKEGTWTLPVNLRPLISMKDFCANHSSGILINMRMGDSARETHQKISARLKEKQHWGIWWVHQIGRIVGMRGMRYISRQNAKKSFLLGSFSILGSWELPEDHIWIGCPPGSKNFPLSAFLMKANNHLSFCLKIHPYVLKDENRAQEIFKKIVSAIQNP